MKKVLLTTVCGPFGIDSDDCTKHVMPELFHAQVTRSQGIFSLRSTYISYGLEYIAKNLNTPAVVLQYPNMKQFKRELKKGYDYVGISFVIPTFEKMKKMCRTVRDNSPDTKIILGGYGTMLPECDQFADYVCREEGLSFMRRLLEEEPNKEVPKHVEYPVTTKIFGLPILKGATILGGLGCPHGCEFCSTSYFHKRRQTSFFKTGKELYTEIRRVQKTLGEPNLPIGIIEEDFLLQKKRAKEYLDCVNKDTEPPTKISCFASAYSISQWDPLDLVKMGIVVLWIGVESRQSGYSKLKGIDVKAVFESLHENGINTLASLIIGYDYHTEENIWEDFEYLVSLNPSLSQILILTPACSTPLFDRLNSEGRLLDLPHKFCDAFHLLFNHPNISKQIMEKRLIEFYDEEYRRLGPSAVRYIEKQFTGYKRFRNSPDPLLKKQADWYKKACLEALPIFPTAVKYAPTEEITAKISRLEQAMKQELGTGGLVNKILGAIVPLLAKVEKFKLKHFAYPQVKMERNAYRMTEGLHLPAILKGDGILKLKPRKQLKAKEPLIVDLKGNFNRTTAILLKKKVKVHLKKNPGPLAIDFSEVVCTKRNSLLVFLKKLKYNKKRISIINMHHLFKDMTDVLNYAKNYFKVFIDIDGLKSNYK
jgi:anti-anti-sigma regulatory factor